MNFELTPELLALGGLWYVAFVFSTTLHEAGHAWAALKMGDPTAYHGGQVSLNPWPHIRREPFGMVVVPILVFALSGWMLGWASAPYDPRWADRHPKRAGLMALAGPAGNLLLLLISGLVLRVGMGSGLWHLSEAGSLFDFVTAAPGRGNLEGLATFLAIFFSLNLLLLVFNLIPLPPLDGSGALPLVMSDRLAIQYRQALRHPAASLVGILLAWKVIDWLFYPAWRVLVRLFFA